jgi:hypothetical protein
VLPAVEVALDRRPYIYETTGQLLIKTSTLLAGESVTVSAAAEPLTRDSAAAAAAVVEETSTAQLELFNATAVQPGTTVALNFSLELLTPPFYGHAVVTVRYGNTTITKRKLLQRALPPAAGYNGSTYQVDHTRRGLLANGWLPFVGQGWWHAPYSYPHSSFGDPTQWQARGARGSPGYRSHMEQEGASVTAEWGKRGHTLVQMQMPGSADSCDGSYWSRRPVCHIDATLNALDDLHASGIAALVTLPWTDGQRLNAQDTAGLNVDMSDLTWQEKWRQIKGNMSLVMDHPAVAGWYVSRTHRSRSHTRPSTALSCPVHVRAELILGHAGFVSPIVADLRRLLQRASVQRESDACLRSDQRVRPLPYHCGCV